MNDNQLRSDIDADVHDSMQLMQHCKDSIETQASRLTDKIMQHVHGSDASNSKISKTEIKRHFDACVEETVGLETTDAAYIGFIVGFRMYERMARNLGKQVTNEESKRFVQIK